MSGVKISTERLSGFVDFFLQPGMKELETCLRDGKHTVQLIEQINEKIQSSEMSLDCVHYSLNVEAMYNNMTKGSRQNKKTVKPGNFSQRGRGG